MTAPERTDLTWGVAVLFDLGVYEVITHENEAEARAAAYTTNTYATEPDDFAFAVIYHPDLGWVCPSTNQQFRTL